MKSYTLILKYIALLATFGVASTLQAQPFFTFDIDDTNGHTNYTGVGASGTVDFTSGSTVDVVITNDSSVTAFITQFYILKPMGIDATGLGPVLEGLTFTAKNWNWTNSGDGSVLNEFSASLDVNLYFGANVPSNPPTNGLPNPSTHTFSFSLDTSGLGPVDWLAYNLAGQGTGAVPHIFVRWQNVNNGDSAKGYDVWGDIPPPVVVPEPSEIALMSLLGMGGLLWVRRRFVSKKK